LSSAGVYEDQNAYPTASEIPKMKIFRFEENIHYANVDMFRKLFTKRIGFRLDDALKSMNNELNQIEQEFRLRSGQIKPNLIDLKKYFQKETKNEAKIEIDLEQLEKEKKEKVRRRLKQCRIHIDFFFQIEQTKKKYRPDFEHIIIDCSPVNYMDMMGIKALIQVS
jgi:hypothetical protein